MLEKISRFLIILVFAISGLLIMEVASPFLSQFVSNEYLKVGFLGVTPLRLVLGLLGLVVFGSLGNGCSVSHEPHHAFFRTDGHVPC